MSKSRRRNAKGRYISKYDSNIRPLLWLMFGVFLLGMVWVYFQKHEEQKLLDPCDGCSFFMVRAYTGEVDLTESLADQVASPEAIVREVFKENGDLMVKVFTCESGLNPETIGDKHLMGWLDGEYLGDSIGIAQIRTGDAGVYDSRPWNRAKANGMSVVEFREKLKEPRYNIEYAKDIFDRQGVGAWYNCYQKVINENN